MRLLDYATSLVMFIIGAIISMVLVFFAPILGIPGWIAGPAFSALMFFYIYGTDRLLGFLMRYTVNLFANAERTSLTETDLNEIEKGFSITSESYGFLAGSVVGILVSFVLAPSFIFGS